MDYFIPDAADYTSASHFRDRELALSFVHKSDSNATVVKRGKLFVVAMFDSNNEFIGFL